MTARSSSSSQKEYKKAGLVSINFPPNNGDFNPIEAVWAKLNKDLAASFQLRREAETAVDPARS